MRRKARGTVELIGDRWTLRIPVEETDPTTNTSRKVRRRIDLGDATEIRSDAAARRAADAWIARRYPEQLSTGEQIRTGAYLQRFLKLDVALYRRQTRRTYAMRIRNDIEPSLGSLMLSRVGTGEIKQLITTLAAKGRARGTIMLSRAILLQALKQARADGFDAQAIDPRLVRVPRMDSAERERRQISPEELDRILAASSYPWKALYACMGYLGLRVSEALGLSWAQLNYQGPAPLASIRHSASDGALYPLKTATSRSDLPMPEELTAILAEYRPLWRANPQGLLFATRSGRPVQAGYVRRFQWAPLLESLGLEPAGFHALRHGLTRRLFRAGCSAQVVKQMMRHSTLAMTQRYTHDSAEDLRAAISAVSAKNKTHQPRPELPTGDAGAGQLQASGE